MFVRIYAAKALAVSCFVILVWSLSESAGAVMLAPDETGSGKNPTDLYAKIPHGTGQTILREALLKARQASAVQK